MVQRPRTQLRTQLVLERLKLFFLTLYDFCVMGGGGVRKKRNREPKLRQKTNENADESLIGWRIFQPRPAYDFSDCDQASSQLEALEGSHGVTALSVGGGEVDEGGNIFSRGGGGGERTEGLQHRGGGGCSGDDQAVASAFRILKVPNHMQF